MTRGAPLFVLSNVEGPDGCPEVTFLTVVVSPAHLPVQWAKMPTNLAGIEVVAVNANDGVSPS